MLPKHNYIEEGLYSHYDIFPTLLDYLDINSPHDGELPGRSFASLLRGEEDHGNESVVIFDEYGPVRMIRDREWKYVHRYPYGPHELYNLTSDPDENYNLIDNPEHFDIIDLYRHKLMKWFEQYVNPRIDGSRLPVTGSGQARLADADHSDKKAFFLRHATGKLPSLDPKTVTRYYD